MRGTDLFTSEWERSFYFTEIQKSSKTSGYSFMCLHKMSTTKNKEKTVFAVLVLMGRGDSEQKKKKIENG